jgi:hypothetical protein
MSKTPSHYFGQPLVDAARDEMMHSLLDGRARYKVQQSDENEKRKITLPKCFEPAYLR